jgi:hypothetical protein
MYNSHFIQTRDGSSYSKLYYRLEGNMLQVRIISSDDNCSPITLWKNVRTVEI